MRKWTVSIHGVRRQNVTKWKCVIVPKGGGRGIEKLKENNRLRKLST